MSVWPSAKAKKVLAALLRNGWTVKRTTGSHRILSRSGWPDVVFAFHDRRTLPPLIAEKRSEILRIAAAFGARNVRLFGSVACGDSSVESDADFLVHDYFGVDLDQVWAAVKRYRPPLKAAIFTMLHDVVGRGW
ncbi:MAG: type II toxin-antitoxin system HicA family toxin [Acidithiobacillales bacterium]